MAVNAGPRRVAIFGATSGIAQAVARVYARDGARLVLVARAPDRLAAVAADLVVRGGTVALQRVADLADVRVHPALMDETVAALGGIDVALIAHGVLPEQAAAAANPALARTAWEVNFVSAAALAERLAERMVPAKSGVLGVLSSVAGERGRADNYVYGSAKAALTAYASGLGHRLRGTGVKVVTVKPGPVDTPMTSGRNYPPALLADVDAVGRQIHDALERGVRVVYAPPRWRWIMAVIRALPIRIFERLRVGTR